MVDGRCKHDFPLGELKELEAMTAWIIPHNSFVICTQCENWTGFGFAAIGRSDSSASLTSGNGQTRCVLVE